MNLSKSLDFFKPDDTVVHIVGCGSVGSTVAENLARAGVSHFALWDFDVVEPHNVVNQMFTTKDCGLKKVDALSQILTSINEDVQIIQHPNGWKGETLSGYVFLCVDSIEIRKQIADRNKYNRYIKVMFDFRTLLESAQHYAADWGDTESREAFIASMDFTHDEAKEEVPVSACGVTLGVATTVRIISAFGVNNYVNFIKGRRLRHFIQVDAFGFQVDAF